MEELGLLNDDDYACRMAQDCFFRRGFAKRRVLFHLRQNGIDRDTADRATAFIDESAQPERAFKIITSRFGCIKDDLQRKKAFALLERLGYSKGEALSALRRAGDDSEFEDGQWD
jgi:regulatory protein